MRKDRRFIRVETIPKNKVEKSEEELNDKIARLYFLADKLGVQIGDNKCRKNKLS